MKPKASAFTLIELMVVVMIIGILAGLMVPVIGTVTGRGRSAVCASNLRALQTGIVQYMGDQQFRRKALLSGNWVADTHHGIWWNSPKPTAAYPDGDFRGHDNIRNGQIWEFVGQYDTYLCPTFKIISREAPPRAESRPGIPYGAKHYTVGGAIVPAFSMSNFEAIRSYARSKYVDVNEPGFNKPSALWLSDMQPWRDLSRPLSFGLSGAELHVGHSPGQYHDGKANCSFFDGHVSQLTPAEILENVEGLE